MSLAVLLDPEVLLPTESLLVPDAPHYSLDELPFDPAPEWEGDDSFAHAPLTPLRYEADSLDIAHEIRHSTVTKRKPFPVPLPRELHWKDSGRAVIAMQRALRAAEFRKRRATGTYYRPTVREVAAFKRARGLPPNGKVYGGTAHRKLLPWYDAHGAWLMAHDEAALAVKREREIARRRALLVSTFFVAYHHAPSVHYTQGPSRMQGVRTRIRPPHFPSYEDCSSIVTWVYWVVGCPDPNGYRFDGYTGWTGTLTAHGRVVSLTYALPGDLVFYGHGAPWKHVAMYIGGGRVLSHGSESGPHLLPIDYRGDRGAIRTYPLGVA